MILTVGATKGSCGQSLLAGNIAAALARQRSDVLLIDGDEQASAATFAQIRSELALASTFTTVQLKGAAIRQQMRQLSAKYREIVIDVGGHRQPASGTDGLRCHPDSVRAPVCQPWAGGQIGSLVAEARTVNEDLKAYAILNAADAQGRDNDDAIAALRTTEGIEALSTVVARRKAFPNAFTAGLSVLEHPQSAEVRKSLSSSVAAARSPTLHQCESRASRKVVASWRERLLLDLRFGALRRSSTEKPMSNQHHQALLLVPAPMPSQR
jgi:chromosome partitioning protein